MKKFSHFFGPLLALVIFVLAIVVLYKQFTAQDVSDVKQNVIRLVTNRPGAICIALAITAVNYLVLVGYDLLAVRFLGIDVPIRKVAFGAFTAYTCGYNFGSTLAGTSVRYRLYSSWGVAPKKILQLLVVLALTFWFGMLALAGTVFIATPLALPSWKYMPFQDTRPLGVVLLFIAVLYTAMSYFFEGYIPIPYTKWKLPVPPFALTVYQILIASADLLLVAAVLYSLWPMAGDGPSGYFPVLGCYLVVFVIGVLTHVPGGYVVMEAIWAALIPDVAFRNEVMASWFLFRIIYYILPLVVAAAMLGWYELRLYWKKSRAKTSAIAPGEIAPASLPDDDASSADPSNSSSAKSSRTRSP